MASGDSGFGDSNRFPTTNWNLVEQAKQHDGADVEAINQLIAKYWKPVFYFIRSRRYPLQQAEDLTQEFFLRFLERDWIRRAEPQRGRFRTFVLTILVRFLSDMGEKRISRQKLFDQRIVAVSTLLTDDDRTFEPPSSETPEAVFFRLWACSLVAHVRNDVKLACDQTGQSAWFEMFEIHSGTAETPAMSMAQLAKQFGLTRDQVRYRLDRIHSHFATAFRAELHRDGCAESEIDAELHNLTQLLSQSG